ncbi:MAG: HAMP domain-containing sensor histidine kinase [Hyphomicrobium sp.]
MSQKPSSTPQTLSRDAAIEAEAFNAALLSQGTLPSRALADVGARIARFNIYGLVWMSPDLIVEATFGPLVDFVATGRLVTDSILALIGLEGEITSLRDKPDKLLELPAIAVPASDGSATRINFTFFWMPDQDRPLLLAYRANSQTELELELSRQIRARLMAEAEVTAKSKELSRANADLESFAAIVSHDLKAPLRHMRQIADDVIIKATRSKDGEEADKLRQLQSLSRRMSHMLSELLDYASLGRKSEALAATDTRALAESIVASMPESGIAIRIAGHWPIISTLAAPLDLIVRNLVQNAIQHHDGATGHITLHCTDAPTALVITVADDGPGIAPAHHDAVFLPFRTLDDGAAKGGTGMGLAMVKKMVETAGGRIAIASDPALARGAVFTVHWPKLITI